MSNESEYWGFVIRTPEACECCGCVQCDPPTPEPEFVADDDELLASVAALYREHINNH